MATKEIITQLANNYGGYAIGIIVLIIIYLLRGKLKRKKKDNNEIEINLDDYKRKPRKKKEEDIAEDPDYDGMIENDLMHWNEIKKQLEAKRGEIIADNARLGAELKKIDSRLKFLKETLNRVGGKGC